MLIGIISDTHNNISVFQKAIGKFNRLKVEAIFHCGDWSSFFMLEACKKIKCEFFSVLGNNDYDLFEFKGRSVGKIYFGNGHLEKEIDGRRIAMCHGNSAFLLDFLLESGRYDLVLSGHTHIASIEKIRNTLHINPGAPFHSRNNIPGIAIYDTKSGTGNLIIL